MLKFIFWSLLAANAVLLAYSQGMLGHFSGNEHEPARMKNQLNAGKMVMVAAPPAPAEPSKAAETVACLAVGNLAAAEARRFESRLASLQLGDRMKRETSAGSDATSHIVYIPPQGSKEGAEKKAGELKALGVTDYFIMSDSSAMKWGISLGVFKSEAAAQALLASLVKQGVHSARIASRGGSAEKVEFRFRGIDAAAKARIVDIAGSFASAETGSCK
ncbi:SPOR domain-containing protein [Massilia sp. R2A-15]|uniref:SPOR domain-containing protein n=1 Tax=Massilia sp. R2A-15 TaxID=3064278 RepID=UPI002737344D|nr:SPOR domain-containing protein [Massilia sp. R2A-15]WLI89695.1 SPOR domain-containing protein [Massilia sp. R2A-15]